MSIGSTAFSAKCSSPLSLSKSSTTTCASLLREHQEICDEIGESEVGRIRLFLSWSSNALIYTLGRMREAGSTKHEKIEGNLKHQISVIITIVENLKLKKEERVKEVSELEFQIALICTEIAGSHQIIGPNGIQVDESDLKTKKLRQLSSQLQELQLERNLRLQKVSSLISAIHKLSVVLSLDFKTIMAKIYPSHVDTVVGERKSISNEILAKLTSEINSLKQEKHQRFLKVKYLGRTLIELWSLMNMSIQERTRFEHVTCLITSTADDVSESGSLSIDVIEQAEVEVERLNVLKATKTKELIFKRQSELEEIYRGVQMDIDTDKSRRLLITLVGSGDSDLSDLLSTMDGKIAIAKQHAQSRKDILNKQGNAKVKAWEQEKGMSFLYNKVPLLHISEDFSVSRQAKEQEKRGSLEQKKLQDQLATEQVALFGSKTTVKKSWGQSTYGNTIVAMPNHHRVVTSSDHNGISSGNVRQC